MIYKYNSALLIDDGDIDLFIIKAMLNNCNFAKNIYVKQDVNSALSFLNGFAATSTEVFPEIIFIDLNMPGRNGFDFIQILKDNPPAMVASKKPKLTVLTSSAFEGDETKVREVFSDIGFVVKPLTNEALKNL
jgi:CheY-like chemotaxis protein